MTRQAASPAGQADWTTSLPKGQGWSEAVALVLSALTVLGIVAGAYAFARWLDASAGQQVGVEEAMLIDLPPPPPAATAASEAAPDAPAIEAPDPIEPSDPPDASPDRPASLPPPGASAQPEALKQVQGPDALIASDVAPPPPPPPSAAKPEPRPDAKPKPPKRATSSAASAKTAARSDAAGQGETAVNRGQASDLKATWGASIRKRVERRKSYPSAAGKAAGTTTVRLVVTRGGTLASLSVAGSSGNPVLDDAAIRAVRSAGSFPSAPAELQDPVYVFTLPISFSR